jgi:hypothetical protein
MILSRMMNNCQGITVQTGIHGSYCLRVTWLHVEEMMVDKNIHWGSPLLAKQKKQISQVGGTSSNLALDIVALAEECKPVIKHLLVLGRKVLPLRTAFFLL